MGRNAASDGPAIHPDMTVLDVVSRYRQAEQVFRRYDEQAGACLCCLALFDPLRKVAGTYGLDLDRLIKDLEAAAKGRAS
jgi:hypothetical protein